MRHHRTRCVIAGLGLVGVLLQLALVPWHALMPLQSARPAVAPVSAVDPGNARDSRTWALQIGASICQTFGDGKGSRDPAAPETPKRHCLVCAGVLAGVADIPASAAVLPVPRTPDGQIAIGEVAQLDAEPSLGFAARGPPRA